MCIKSEGRAIFWNMHPVIKLIRPFCFHQKNCPQGLSPLALGLYIHVWNKTKYHKIMRQKGSFWNWYQIMGTIKALKYCQNLYQVVVCPCPGAIYMFERGARWLSGRVSDSGARGPGFETYRPRVVSLSKTLYSPRVLVNYPGSDGSVPTWLKNCWLGR